MSRTIEDLARAVLGVIVVTSLAGCHAKAPTVQPRCRDCHAAEDGAYEAAILAWRAERIAALRAEQGWLALAGLTWFGEGEHRLGAAPDADLVFPAGAPAQIGRLRSLAGEVSLQVAPGVDARIGGARVTEAVLRPDADRVRIGERFTFLIIARGERLGLRLYDSEAPERREFVGVDSFPIAEQWRIQARFEAYATPREVEHPTVLGTVQAARVPGVAVFSIGGQEQRLTPILEAGPAGDVLLFVFRDQTSGVETYTGGRFLIAAPAQDGTIELDFNRAHNPPCAFTAYATCPVPLPENRLAVRVEAGEKLPADHPAP